VPALGCRFIWYFMARKTRHGIGHWPMSSAESLKARHGALQLAKYADEFKPMNREKNHI
jgi:hypothetical protein